MHSANIIFDVRSCSDDLRTKKKIRMKRCKDFCTNSQSRWIFILNLELEQALFMAKSCLLKYHRFHLSSEPNVCNEKLFFLLQDIHHSPLVQFFSFQDIHYPALPQFYCILLLSAMWEKHNSTSSHGFKFPS